MSEVPSPSGRLIYPHLNLQILEEGLCERLHLIPKQRLTLQRVSELRSFRVFYYAVRNSASFEVIHRERCDSSRAWSILRELCPAPEYRPSLVVPKGLKDVQLGDLCVYEGAALRRLCNVLPQNGVDVCPTRSTGKLYAWAGCQDG